MSERASVLYDIPGPRARRVNLILSVVFGALLLLLAWYVISTLASKDQLTAAKWSPFLEADNWTTYLLPGLWATLEAAALSVVIALPIGAILGIGRLSDHAWIRWPVGVIVEFFRAIPVIILMLFAFEVWFFVLGSSSPFAAVVIGLVLYNGSVLAEVVRAGILAVPKGQTEAGFAIGLTKTQLMTQVLLPQAVTTMLPAVVSQLVVIVKDTALGGILVGYVELRRAGQHLRQQLRQSAAHLCGRRRHLHHHQHAVELAVDLPGAQAAHQAWWSTGGDPAGGRRDRSAGAPGDRGAGRAGGRRVPEVVRRPAPRVRGQRAISVALDSRMTVTRT